MQSQSLSPETILRSPTREYRIKKVLGAGGFGITYLATSVVKHGNVTFTLNFAIKELFTDTCIRDTDGVNVYCTPSSKLEIQQTKEDFLKEAKRLQSLCNNSNNIVHVNESFEANGTAYYVMEYLDGGPLKPCSESVALELILEVADAVKVLHQNRLVHMDIKPDNIVMKTEENGKKYPVLIDFGIAKHFDKDGNPTSKPNPKGVSEGYAPIEQLDLITEFSPTLDIYALGATLLWLVTGKNPPSAVKLSTDNSQSKLKEFIPDTVGPQTRKAILHAMRPNKSERPQSVVEFIKEIEAISTEDGGDERCDDEKRSSSQGTKGTKPIKNHTEKISKSKFGLVHIVLLLSVILGGIGLWLVNKEVFIDAGIIIIGLIAVSFIAKLISKFSRLNFGTLLSISWLSLIAVLLFWLGSTAIWSLLGIIIVSFLLLLALSTDHNYKVWLVTAIFFIAACFCGYVKYSNEIFNKFYDEQVQEDNIEDATNDDVEIERKPELSIMYDRYGTDKNMPNEIDLGLSVKWADVNLGADGKPSDTGATYMWGQMDEDGNVVVSKDKSMQWLEQKDIIDQYGNLTPKYDIATAVLGEGWRLPTVDEINELLEKCTIETGELDGQKEKWIKSTNGSSIFLPISKLANSSDGTVDWYGEYLSSSGIDDGTNAYSLNVGGYEPVVSKASRYSQCCYIRPVRK